MTNKYEAVIFDWAGTTVDYGCFAPVEAFVESFRRFGIEPTVDEVREPMGMLKIDHIRTMMKMDRISNLWQEVHGRPWTEEDVVKVYEASETVIMEILHNFAEVKPYVLDVIKEIRAKGMKIGSTTGYTDEMMAIVAPQAEANGYCPDAYFTPNSVGDKGRPYPYMVFENLKVLGVSAVDKAIKVGDTVADIKEGISCGMKTVGVIEGSSIMALSQAEFEALSEEDKEAEREKCRQVYNKVGADYIINDMRGLLDII